MIPRTKSFAGRHVEETYTIHWWFSTDCPKLILVIVYPHIRTSSNSEIRCSQESIQKRFKSPRPSQLRYICQHCSKQRSNNAPISSHHSSHSNSRPLRGDALSCGARRCHCGSCEVFIPYLLSWTDNGSCPVPSLPGIPYVKARLSLYCLWIYK